MAIITRGYGFVPAAVGGVGGRLVVAVDHCGPLGHNVATQRNATSGARVAVRVIDVAEWMGAHFARDDHVVLKMDVEGAEFGIVEALHPVRESPEMRSIA